VNTNNISDIWKKKWQARSACAMNYLFTASNDCVQYGGTLANVFETPYCTL